MIRIAAATQHNGAVWALHERHTVQAIIGRRARRLGRRRRCERGKETAARVHGHHCATARDKHAWFHENNVIELAQLNLM